MKTTWLKNRGADEVVLFFNGWGMDDRIASFLYDQCADDFPADLLACSDYRTLQPEVDFAALSERYGRITVVAWSFGVWAAQHAGLERVHRAIAVNGTRNPVSVSEGIPPDIFNATLSGYSDENRKRFNRRMCGSGEVLDLFSTLSPGRDTAAQLEELACLGDHLRSAIARSPATWRYSHAIIGGRDMIFAAPNQFNAWKGVPQTIIAEMPHFPFYHFRTFTEVLECMG